MYLGIDTSNYTTSVALYSKEDMINLRKMLEVPKGSVGLRQSDAHFQHIKNLPDLFEQLPKTHIEAIGVSSRPRAVEGSYMPVFMAGVSFAQTIAHFLSVPLYEFSHQQGHLAAALCSCGKLELLGEPFCAWHISGGTTDLLEVTPFLQAERIGGSTDCHAGQIIDRVGNMLGFNFPSGPEIEKSAMNYTKKLDGKLTVNGRFFSLSGIENQARKFLELGESPENISFFVLNSICKAVRLATQDIGQGKFVCCGGVASNSYIRKTFPQFAFSEPWASCDNAVGIAVLAENSAMTIY